MKKNNLHDFDDYRAYLRSVLEDRIDQRPSYSLRAFARDLSISAPRLSEILNRKRKISVSTAIKIGQALGLDGDSLNFFSNLVEGNDSNSENQRNLARLRNSRYTPGEAYENLSDDIFAMISNWYYFPIIELTRLDSFENSPDWIADALHITKHEAREAVARLKRLEMLEEVDGKLQKCQSNYATEGDVPSEATRSFHRKVLRRAASLLEDNNLADREMSCNIFAVDRSKIPAAKLFIRKFRRDFVKEFESGSVDDVYGLSMQLFSFTRGGDA